MADKQNPELEGEGSYKGSKDYNDRTREFVEREGDHIEQLADDAEDALDPEDPEELTDAEKEGLKKGRH